MLHYLKNDLISQIISRWEPKARFFWSTKVSNAYSCVAILTSVMLTLALRLLTLVYAKVGKRIAFVNFSIVKLAA